jgi:hypothetical protein
MVSIFRSLALGAGALSILTACGINSYGTASGSNPAVSGTGTTTTGGTTAGTGGLPSGGETGVKGTHNRIVGTPPSNMVSAVVGAKLTVPFVFTSSDGRSISGFAINNSLGAALPPGWTGPESFGCQTVSTGSGCVLNLVYKPTAYTTQQAVTLNYVFIDNSNEPVTGDTTSFNYQATTNDNVTATLAPAGQISATVGAAAQTVNVTFTTDDMEPASALSLSGSVPSPLPAGWTGPATTTCATVSAGNACTLSWSYMPTVPDNGTLEIDYAYSNDSGTAKMASFNIPYSATANDSIVGTVTPSAVPINVVFPGSQPVWVTFTTNDTFVASNLLVTTDLTALPPGWSVSSPNFSCAAISTGTGCQLSLTYSPTTNHDNATLQLVYTYNNNAGTAMQGSVNIVFTSS